MSIIIEGEKTSVADVEAKLVFVSEEKSQGDKLGLVTVWALLAHAKRTSV